MFCLTTVKTDFSGKAFREAIYKVVLRGNERPQRINAATEKEKIKYVLSLKTGSILFAHQPGTKQSVTCLCVCLFDPEVKRMGSVGLNRH